MAAKAERDESSTKVRRSRRELLAGAAGALGIMAAEAIGKAAPARAADGDNLVLGKENHAEHQTLLILDGNADEGVLVASSDAPTHFPLSGRNTSGPGVLGHSVQGDGVWGQTDSGTGVVGLSSGGDAVFGKSVQGNGVVGLSVDFSGGSAFGGVVGDSNTNAGVVGFTSAPKRGAGEFSHLGGGRGGIFTGGKAQLKLSPSSASTHPTKGQRGDLFVDKSGRLWFCKGKTTWVQLA
jgi:hypothetical protein